MFTPRRKNRRAGFSLIEAMVSIIITGIGIAALMAVMASGTRVNDFGNKLSTAVFLAEQARALTDNVNFEDLPSCSDLTWTPLDGAGNPISDLSRYQQHLAVEPVDPATMTAYAGADPPAYRLTAVVTAGNTELTRITWLRAR